MCFVAHKFVLFHPAITIYCIPPWSMDVAVRMNSTLKDNCVAWAIWGAHNGANNYVDVFNNNGRVIYIYYLCPAYRGCDT